jgi:hypothetical protein
VSREFASSDVGALLARVGELIRGKTRRLRPYEEAILAAVREKLSPAERDVLGRQLAVRPLTQRSFGGRMVLFAFDRRRQQQIPLFDERDDEHCLARVRFRSGSSRNVVLIVIHHGHLSTLEFRRTLAHLDPGQIEITDVALHVRELRVADAVDRLEHGRNDDVS